MSRSFLSGIGKICRCLSWCWPIGLLISIVLVGGACSVQSRTSTHSTFSQLGDTTRSASWDGDADAGALLYDHLCRTCHTIGGGRRIGPDLVDVHQRRDHDWLVRFIDDPVTMNATDPIARQLLSEYGGRAMADTGLDRQQIEDVLAFIVAVSEEKARSSAETVHPPGVGGRSPDR